MLFTLSSFIDPLFFYHNVSKKTRAGPVLIAINPFKKLPLYTKDSLESYGTKTEDNHEPHVYSTMASAFKAMMQGVFVYHVQNNMVRSI